MQANEINLSCTLWNGMMCLAGAFVRGMAVPPVQPEGGHLGALGKVDDFGGGGPESGKGLGAVHIERVGKAARVGNDMLF